MTDPASPPSVPPTVDPDDAAVRDAWHDFMRWDRTAIRLKKRLFMHRCFAVALSIGGTLLGVIGATAERMGLDQLQPVFAVASTAMLAIATTLIARFLGGPLERQWVNARSVAESIKGAVYRFQARVPPFNTAKRCCSLVTEATLCVSAGRAAVSEVDSASAAELDDEIAAKRREKAAAVRDRKPDAGLIETLPERLEGAESYLSARVEQQVWGYYWKKSRELDSTIGRFRWVEVAAGILATICGGVATAFPFASAWAAAFTSIGVVLVSHVGINRFERDRMSYRATALQLDSLVRGWRCRSAEERARESARVELIRECENVISIENQAWMVEPEPTMTAPVDHVESIDPGKRGPA